MLVVITCFFNPNRCQYRLANYKMFHKELQRVDLPVYTVELAFGDSEFELTEEDATELKQLRAADLMFQKERMLNVALEMLPDKYDQVIWMDCDLIYPDDRWVLNVEAALKKHLVVQPYKYAISLPKCKLWNEDRANMIYYDCWGSGRVKRSFAYYFEHRHFFANLHHGHVGYIWAAQRNFLERHKFYDPIITGAGDLFMLMAYTGYFGWIDYLEEFKNLNDATCFHFFEWAFPVYGEVRGKLGYTEDLVLHLWHGEIIDRDYLGKSRHLHLNQFDPSVDLALDENGCWRWNSDKEKLHKALRDLFKSQQTQ